ncbi:hypothetical protein M441DRAFT_305287 [Trichoderma asperellum CBS 433.97]|uniref:Uncharacterized protein n=1 Tax=Trichoderma asperellum (strain ATCC 204424 / CBS 433.97 / NBRC 101777) TaxID=1042311 RepID=A0A2T3ZJS3_TRIA4|nr:hypothetical protein M441DRAFT_305287 [Trichoderma asperellum CBS 433.97]PTB45061.1 hypothetical protein M441DRAFT_305287 [Trichoderma asperellum CBS 433.97]
MYSVCVCSTQFLSSSSGVVFGLAPPPPAKPCNKPMCPAASIYSAAQRLPRVRNPRLCRSVPVPRPSPTIGRPTHPSRLCSISFYRSRKPNQRKKKSGRLSALALATGFALPLPSPRPSQNFAPPRFRFLVLVLVLILVLVLVLALALVLVPLGGSWLPRLCHLLLASSISIGNPVLLHGVVCDLKGRWW